MLLNAIYWYCCYFKLFCSVAAVSNCVSHLKPDCLYSGKKHGFGLFVILWDIRRVCECK